MARRRENPDNSEKREWGDMYHGYMMCPDLTSGILCFRVQKYNQGSFETAFHEHVPRRRISQDRAGEVLRALVSCFSNWPGNFILQSHLNDRGTDPPRYPGFRHDVSYPEPGVLRHTVSGVHAHAWHDEVIVPTSFRISQRTQDQS
jgi:hypothetical protein